MCPGLRTGSLRMKKPTSFFRERRPNWISGGSIYNPYNLWSYDSVIPFLSSPGANRSLSLIISEFLYSGVNLV